MGAHPKAPSGVIDEGETLALNTLIRRFPEKMLGKPAARKFQNTLPFLFKVLAAAQPLSVQVHPDAAAAEAGFNRENRMNIAIEAPRRNYRDPWPKPEIICAVEPFVALNGFRGAGDIVERFQAFCPEHLSGQIRMLENEPHESGIKKMFESLLRMAPERQKAICESAARAAGNLDLPEAGWVGRLYEYYPSDIGVLAPLYLNLIRLEPHSAMFLTPGRIHAYLEGIGIELMANSDNVIRGGLTAKHIDVGELLQIASFDPAPPEILRPVARSACESYYPAEAEEFRLSVIRVRKGDKCRMPEDHGIEILLCMEGGATLHSANADEPLILKKGGSALIPACTDGYSIEGDAFFFKASTGDIQ